MVNDLHWYPFDAINQLFGALRLFKNINVGYCQLIIQPKDWANGYTGNLAPIKGTTCRNYPSIFDKYYWNGKEFPEFTLNDIESVKQIYSYIKENQNKKIELALRRYNQCLLRDNDEDAIIDTAIGLEALLSKENQELSHKISLRAAYLSTKFENAFKSPSEVFKKIKKFYKLRSSLVHGSNYKFDINIKNFGIEFISQLIVALLKNPEYLKPELIDEEILSHFTRPNP